MGPGAASVVRGGDGLSHVLYVAVPVCGGLHSAGDATGPVRGCAMPSEPSSSSDPSWFTPVTSRILLVPSRAGTSPWAPGLGPVRPVWTLTLLRRYAPDLRNPLYRAIANGTIPLDRSPVLDVRQLTLRLHTAQDRYWYSHLRGVYARYLPHGVRLAAMVTWGEPSKVPRWPSRWGPRAMGALWVWPAMHPHSRWLLSVDAWVDSYQRWFDPVLGFDSGVVLDTRMLALAGVPIPLPPAMVDRLRPLVRCLSLADVPEAHAAAVGGWAPGSRPWLAEAPWLPGTSGRYRWARWQAFLDQFPDVPVYVPAVRTAADVPPWVREAVPAAPSCLPDGAVWPPPDARMVSLRFPRLTSSALIAWRHRHPLRPAKR